MALSLQQIQAANNALGIPNTPQTTSVTPVPTAVQQTQDRRTQLAQQATQKTSSPTAQPAPTGNFATNINTDLTNRATDLAHSVTDTPQRVADITKQTGSGGLGLVGGLAESGLRASGAVAGGLLDFATDAVKAIPGVVPLLNHLNQQYQANPDKSAADPGGVGQKLVSALNDYAQAHPNLAKDANAAGNIVAAVPGMEGLQSVGEKLPGAISGVKSSVSDIANGAKNLVTKTPQDIANTTLETATKDATPSYGKSLVGDSPIKNPDGTITPRITEGGLNGRTVNPTALEKQAGATLAKVPDYPVNGTNLEKFQSIQPEIAKQGQALRSSLAKEDFVASRQDMMDTVKTAINKVPDSSMSLSKTDPIIKNYLRVASNAVEGTPQNLEGVLKFSNKLDQAYENARGKLAFGSDKISALDEVHTAARNALKEYLIKNAANTDVKAALQYQWDLYRASDVLRSKAEAESGTSIGRLIQNHPTIAKIGKTVGRATGLDVITHHLP